MKQALTAIKNEMPVKIASQAYSVPKTTLLFKTQVYIQLIKG